MDAMNILLKRAYDLPEPRDGFRILVDRLWPRGVSKDSAHIDLWLKEIAPTTPLRKWFGHEPEKWAEFRGRYFQELQANSDAVAQLTERVRHGCVTLVYGAKDRAHSHAVVLKEYMEKHEEGTDVAPAALAADRGRRTAARCACR
jgi:uncharacterized protein YeaO (DUF488 family)